MNASLAQMADEQAEPRPRSPSLLVLSAHPLVAERTRAVAAELARVLVTRTMLEMGILVANENKNHVRGQ